ncbi:uncharacterized protein TNIN_497541 [Trichonephila inaurata madagascariensis]|uniref:Uncharacterized protein n=1 Tax=Trichonephila inaurata madagascariensis TaxID=2747483 RepID=A0A8X6MGV3_9ARAC|nr:uncharacterized protein TNIN_497541 [Trichonephila inaurata madagascariensis]
MLYVLNAIEISMAVGSLEWLKLGDNQLSSIPAEPLRRLKKLRQLDLRQNRIDRITEDDFKHYGRTLKFIYLQKNRYASKFKEKI